MGRNPCGNTGLIHGGNNRPVEVNELKAFFVLVDKKMLVVISRK
jgi:hypothetical protein